MQCTMNEFNNLPNFLEERPNLTQLSERLIIGPQGEIIELLELFNDKFETNLGITKKFHFKPGAYKEIKDKYTTYCLRWDMKPSGMSRLFDRHQQFGWRVPQFKNPLVAIENGLKNLRNTGAVWHDNEEDLETEYTRLQQHLVSELLLVEEVMPNLEVKLKLSLNEVRSYGGHYGAISPLGREEQINTQTKLHLNVMIVFEESIMRIHSVQPEGDIVIDELPMPKIIITSTIDLLANLSRCWRKDYLETATIPRSCNTHISGVCISNDGIMQHPYISGQISRLEAELTNGEYSLNGNTCRGNMDTEIIASLSNFQLCAHIFQVSNWMTNYFIPQTAPIHNIGNMFAGLRNVNEILMQSVQSRLNNRTNSGNCGYPYQVFEHIKNYALKGTRYSDRQTDEIRENYTEYLEAYPYSDLECHKCTLKDKCEKFEFMEICLNNERSLECDEEAILGTILDFREVTMDTFLGLAYPEMSFTYHKLLSMHKNGEDLQARLILSYALMAKRVGFVDNDFSDLRNELDNDMVDDFGYWFMDLEWNKLLIEAANVLGEDYVYDLISEKVTLFREKKKPRRKSKTNDDLPFDSPEVEAWLHANDEEALTTMTPEERTILWASQQGGGSQNI